MNEPQFIIYDLRVETIEGDRPFVCSHEVGSAFEVRGENLHLVRVNGDGDRLTILAPEDLIADFVDLTIESPDAFNVNPAKMWPILDHYNMVVTGHTDPCLPWAYPITEVRKACLRELER